MQLTEREKKMMQEFELDEDDIRAMRVARASRRYDREEEEELAGKAACERGEHKGEPGAKCERCQVVIEKPKSKKKGVIDIA